MSTTWREGPAGLAEKSLLKAEEAGRHWALDTEREAELEAERPAKKREAIERIIATNVPPAITKANAAGTAVHSPSSAEAIVEMDAEYAAHLAKLRTVVKNKMYAQTTYQIALARAALYTALLNQPAAVEG